jgi:hypothetical protein
MSDTGVHEGRGRFASALVRLILLAGFATAGYGIHAWNAAKAEEYAQLDYLARFAAKSASYFFGRFDDALDHLGQDIIDRGGMRDLRMTHALLERYQRTTPEIAGAGLFDLDGKWILSSLRPPGTPLPSFKNRPDWLADFRNALDTKELTIGRPIPGVLISEQIIPLKQVVRSAAGEKLFVLAVVTTLSNQQKIWKNLDLPEDAVIGIVRSDGYFQSRFPADGIEAHVYAKPWRGPVTEAVFGPTPSNSGHVEA